MAGVHCGDCVTLGARLCMYGVLCRALEFFIDVHGRSRVNKAIKFFWLGDRCKIKGASHHDEEAAMMNPP
eukprot:scaffold4866_cov147-Skeletonema_marinoi.AAC.7